MAYHRISGYSGVFDKHGRIVIPGYEMDGRKWDGDSLPHVPLPVQHSIRFTTKSLPKLQDDQFIDWVMTEKVNVFSPHVDITRFRGGSRAPDYLFRLDRHYSSDYAAIGTVIETGNPASGFFILRVAFGHFEDFAYAKLRFL